MPRILLTTSFPDQAIVRQTPGRSGAWEEFEFVFEPSEDEVDAWTVYDNLPAPITQAGKARNTLLITGEPATVRKYRSRFTDQFAQVWTAQHSIRHRHRRLRNEAQPWHYGLQASRCHGKPLDFDDLSSLPCPDKPKLLSVICSNKTITADQRQRRDFVRFLQAELGDSVDVFGRGIRTVEDKADAIWPYKYHIVLENDHSDHFMTEKICDAYLGWSYPIYFGGTEAYHRFPEGSFSAIDIYKPEQSLAIIQQCLAADVFGSAQTRIAEARHLVLRRHNLFAMLAEYWRQNLVDCSAESIRLLPKSHRAQLVINQVARFASRSRSRRRKAA